MEPNILINKNKFELKYIRIQPSKLISEELKPGYTKFTDGKYFWSQQTTQEVEACWVSEHLFDGITESSVKKNKVYQVIDGKLYHKPFLELVFENNTLVEYFETDKEMDERILYLRQYVFTEAKFAQINSENFQTYSNYHQWYGN